MKALVCQRPTVVMPSIINVFGQCGSPGAGSQEQVLVKDACIHAVGLGLPDIAEALSD